LKLKSQSLSKANVLKEESKIKKLQVAGGYLAYCAASWRLGEAAAKMAIQKMAKRS